MESSAIHDPEVSNVFLEYDRRRELESYLLRIPTLRTVEFRPPVGAGYTRFADQDRGRVRDFFPELGVRGMLVV